MAPRPEPSGGAFLLSLHDVCPATWADYQPLLAAVARYPDLPVTLLVVPDFHGHGRFTDDAYFCAALQARYQAGDELVLHGYYHHDDSPPPTTPGDWVRRRLLTHEGEFAALGEQMARERIQRGLTLFRQCGWSTSGFVPPGWVINPLARQAIVDAGFRYWSDQHGLHCLRTGAFFSLPTLVWSARSAWRRGVFDGIHQVRRWWYRREPVLRLAVHPVDMRHRRSRRAWLSTLEELAAQRQALTKSQWLNQVLETEQ